MRDGQPAFETIAVERRGQVAVLTLNRPDKLNALSGQLRAEVAEALVALRADDEVRALVLTGAGRGFCSGVDLTGDTPLATGRGFEGLPQEERLDELGWVGRWALMWRGFDKPIVGAINGVAAGAGMSTALACDVRVGCEHTRFKSVFVERAISPDSGLSFFLPRVVGYAAAADILLTSRLIAAEEAKTLGLLNRLVAAEELVDAAVAYAEEMAQWPPLAVRMAKRVLQHNLDVDLEEALRFETLGLAFARRAPNDAAESRAAFLEKRKGAYTGT